MELTHFLGIIPLMTFLILSVLWYGKGLIHLLTIGYSVTLAWIAVVNQWELLFLPVCLVTVIIGLILEWYAMTRGSWL